ncbi:MAG: ribosome biogenesis GTP-binding protein YihA/YsxC [Syntrophobacteraceae bacterium]|nr:ribosome biogenesis GTP-binding protein YihA/YsxC [Desulfobacteraceae bacterium]
MEIVFPIRTAEFVKSAVHQDQYPPAELPEVAFAGRSNVGKSSLINCLVQRKKLVKTSKTPGRTQTINFFRINNEFYFVDLPGYGFARVSEKIRAQWGPMVENYLSARPSLKGIVLILDVRHPPTPHDLNLLHWLQDRHLDTVAVMTKADKIKRGEWRPRLKEASLSLGIPADDLVLFSAETQQGRPELLQKISRWIEGPADLEPTH